MQEQTFVCIAAAGAIILLCLMSYPLLYLGIPSSEMQPVRQEATRNAANRSAHCSQSMGLAQGTRCSN